MRQALAMYGLDFRAMVSAIHRHEMAPWDPDESSKAITNGDHRNATGKFFIDILKRLFRIVGRLGTANTTAGGRSKTPGEKRIRNTHNWVIKDPILGEVSLLRALGLNPMDPHVLDPDKPTIGYSGRDAWEKAGRIRAFPF